MTASWRVLVVEDNPENQMLTSAVLERDGFVVEIADSAIAALNSLSLHTPDLILMDIQLAGDDGLALTRQVEAQPATASTPVIALTALAMAGDRQEAISAGCCGYIAKPIDTRTFVDQIRAFLGPHSAQPDATHPRIQEETRA